MRLFVRVIAAALLVLLAIIFLGPMAPRNTFFYDVSVTIREAMNAWWGFPFGLPSN